MTNLEHLIRNDREKLNDLLTSSIAQKDGNVCLCEETECGDCDFHSEKDCRKKAKAWLNAEHNFGDILKFAEWLENNSYLNWVGEGNDVNSMSAEEVLLEYNDEQNK